MTNNEIKKQLNNHEVCMNLLRETIEALHGICESQDEEIECLNTRISALECIKKQGDKENESRDA